MGLERILKLAQTPFKASLEFADMIMKDGFPPKDLFDACILPLRIKVAYAPLVLTLALYGAAVFGCVKATSPVYDVAKTEIKYQIALNEISDIPSNMNMPEGFGSNNSKP